MDVEQLIEQYPRLYHMASAGSWPSIRDFGLRTTQEIVTTSGLDATAQEGLLRARRSKSIEIAHPELGVVTVRDQGPLILNNLRPALIDMTEVEWFETLNDRVFFWLHPIKLSKLLSARRYRQFEQDVLTLDTRSLVKAHLDRVRLSPYNSGATIRPNAPARGSRTFLSIEQYPWNEWRRRRVVHEAVIELAVVGGVADVANHVHLVERRRGAEVLETVWKRPRATV